MQALLLHVKLFLTRFYSWHFMKIVYTEATYNLSYEYETCSRFHPLNCLSRQIHTQCWASGYLLLFQWSGTAGNSNLYSFLCSELCKICVNILGKLDTQRSITFSSVVIALLLYILRDDRYMSDP